MPSKCFGLLGSLGLFMAGACGGTAAVHPDGSSSVANEPIDFAVGHYDVTLQPADGQTLPLVAGGLASLSCDASLQANFTVTKDDQGYAVDGNTVKLTTAGEFMAILPASYAPLTLCVSLSPNDRPTDANVTIRAVGQPPERVACYETENCSVQKDTILVLGRGQSVTAEVSLVMTCPTSGDDDQLSCSYSATAAPLR